MRASQKKLLPIARPTQSISPELILRLTCQSPASIELEATWVDKYYIDPNNQHSYPGHELVNARAEWLISEKLRSTLTVTNLLDTGYAERADYGFGNYRYFVGEPRSAVLGLYFAL